MRCVVVIVFFALFGSAFSRRPSHASLFDPNTILTHQESSPPTSNADSLTNFWSVLPNKAVVDGVAPDYLAVGSFSDTLNQTGWGILEIWASSNATDSDQSYAAGFLEGYVTAKHIYTTFLNLAPQVFGNDTSPPAPVLDFLNKQEAWALSQIAANPSDTYWNQVGNVFQQYAGLEAGYASAVADSHSALPVMPHWGFQMLNGIGDLFDIIPTVMPDSRVNWFTLSRFEAETLHSSRGMCSALIKVTGNYSDLFVSHSSWYIFVNTNRIFKTYHMAYQNPAIAAQTVSFSSYPGFLESLDDFYLMSSGLAMVQTSNGVMNNSVYSSVKPESLLAWQRARVAAAMAHSGQEWFDTFRNHFSGTYANQYMVVDFNMFTPNKPLPAGLLWVVEEMAGLILGHDQTAALRRGYWGSYNVPYYKQIYEASGYEAMAAANGNYFTNELCPRAQIFRRDQDSVTDIDSLKRLLRSNNYLTDPYSFDGQKQNPSYAICSRGDLLASPRASGCYDTKVSSYLLGAKQLKAHIINGPTTNGGSLPPFSWEAAPFASVSHVGLPSVYDFDFVEVSPSSLPSQ